MIDVLEGVAEHVAAGDVPVAALPLVLQGRQLLERHEAGKIHRAEVQRGHFGADAFRRLEPLFQRHARPATGGDVDDGIAARADLRQELHEDFGIGSGAAIHRIACMQVQHGRAGLRCRDGFFDDLRRRQRQIRRLARRVDRAGDGAGNDDWAAHHFAPVGAGSARFLPAVSGNISVAMMAQAMPVSAITSMPTLIFAL